MLSDPRILVVDDEEIVREPLRRWFIHRGFDVDVAGNGKEAVDMADTNRYAAIIMDLEMPVMGGKEAISQIMGSDPKTPILVLTGFSADSGEVMKLGARGVFRKPTRLSDLEAEVRKVMR